jgi:hypothetical protein
MNIPGKLVVRAYAPGRRWTVVLSVLLIGALALYGMFELGRYKAGYDAMLAAGERNSLQQQIDALLHTQHELKVQLAAADEARVAEVRERADVARTIGELQAEVERQQKDVEFYRGIVAQPGQGEAAAVRVEQFHVATLPGEQRYALRFSLIRQQRPGEAISGTLAITVDGTREATPVSADLRELTGGGPGELNFSFRYNTSIEQPVTLPPGFKADRVTLEVRPGRKGMAPYRQTFVWNAEPG